MEGAGGYEELVREIMRCTRCPLHASRRNPVPGEGPLNAEVMLVGEAPGRNEDLQGRPFVGMAGKLLDAALEQAGMPRETVYITNVVKCRPPGNREPKPEEMLACLPYLKRQIEIVKPKLIVALGRISGELLYEQAGLPWRGVAEERGAVREAILFGVSVKLVVTYHPAAALYNPELKEYVVRDIALAAREARRTGRGPPEGKRRTLDEFL